MLSVFCLLFVVRARARLGLMCCLCLPSLVLGTDATHAEHIETIKNRNYVGVQANGGFVPGELGMGLVEGLFVCVHVLDIFNNLLSILIMM